MRNTVYLQYYHDDREIRPAENQAELDNLSMENLEEYQKSLDTLGVDGLLILDKEKGKWFLVFKSTASLIAQKTARRQADTIVRSGYLLENGERIKANYPMEELSKENIGDLWKTVQQKYLPGTDLRGMLDQKEVK